jgi:hypothetical protein
MSRFAGESENPTDQEVDCKDQFSTLCGFVLGGTVSRIGDLIGRAPLRRRDMSNKAVTLLSGGMDSAVMLWNLKAQGYQVHALSFDYGQRHKRELSAAQNLALATRIQHDTIDLESVGHLLAGAPSSQTNPSVPVPEGHYA